eukprot:6782624-Lingulodinium_polyedra.AAC.1
MAGQAPHVAPAATLGVPWVAPVPARPQISLTAGQPGSSVSVSASSLGAVSATTPWGPAGLGAPPPVKAGT